MRSTTTAASTRSPRCFGNTLPRLGSPTWWPARPMRCRPRGDRAAATRPGRRGRRRPCRCRARATTWRTRPLSRPAFSSSSISEPPLPRQRAVVGLHQLARRRRRRARPARRRGPRRSTRQLVEPGGQPLGQPAGVDEDERRAVLLDQLEQAGVDRRPDAAARRRRPPPGRSPARRCISPRRAHVLDRHDDLDVERLAHAGVDDRDRPRPAAVAAAEEAGDLVERALGGRQADALRRGPPSPTTRCSSRSSVSGEVGAALGGGHGVDLVDDDGLDAGAASRGPGDVSMQVERLGRGDEDVGRVAHELAALVGRRVAGAHADGRARAPCVAEALGGQADARQRRPQVPLDVDGQGPQRRDVERPGCARSARATGSVISRSMPHRKAASVLPEPVGARISVWSPAAMAGQPCSWPPSARRRWSRTTPGRARRTGRQRHGSSLRTAADNRLSGCPTHSRVSRLRMRQRYGPRRAPGRDEREATGRRRQARARSAVTEARPSRAWGSQRRRSSEPTASATDRYDRSIVTSPTASSMSRSATFVRSRFTARASRAASRPAGRSRRRPRRRAVRRARGARR